MSLKRECDSCGNQEDHQKNSMVVVDLPAIVDAIRSRKPKHLDLCVSCAVRVHDAADPQPKMMNEAIR